MSKKPCDYYVPRQRIGRNENENFIEDVETALTMGIDNAGFLKKYISDHIIANIDGQKFSNEQIGYFWETTKSLINKFNRENDGEKLETFWNAAKYFLDQISSNSADMGKDTIEVYWEVTECFLDKFRLAEEEEKLSNLLEEMFNTYFITEKVIKYCAENNIEMLESEETVVGGASETDSDIV